MAKIRGDLPVLAFKSQLAWDKWLASQPAGTKGLWLKLAKKSSGIASVSKAEATDTALCHGWIDGQLESFDDDFWLVRFTPRHPDSKWSEKNRSRALELIAQKLMRPAGLSEIDRARTDGRWDLAYAPQSTARVPDDLRIALAKNGKAARFFATIDGANRYSILHRVQTAKKPETRATRIATYVAMLAEGKTIHPQKTKFGKRK